MRTSMFQCVDPKLIPQHGKASKLKGNKSVKRLVKAIYMGTRAHATSKRLKISVKPQVSFDV